MCKNLLTENQINFDFSFVDGQVSEEDILKIPLLLISEYFEKWTEFTQYY